MVKKYDDYQYPSTALPKFHFIDKNTILFFDAVSFSKGFSFQKMKNIIIKIEQSIDELKTPYSWNSQRKRSGNDLIMLPTGDGYGIAFNPNVFTDTKVIDISEDLLRKLTIETGFKIRMGIARDSVVRYLDANGIVNLFGTGVIMAFRVMNSAGENQIIIHETVAVGLKNNPDFFNRLSCPYTIEIKHQKDEIVYIYKYPGCRNMNPPK